MAEPLTERNTYHPQVPEVSLRVHRSGVSYPNGPLTLHIQSYKPIELAAAAITSFTRPTWTSKQNQALRQLQDMLTQWLSDCSTYEDGVPADWFMYLLIDSVSDMFFMGSLKKIRFEWRDTGHYHRSSDEFWLGSAGLQNDGWEQIIMTKSWWLQEYADPARRQAEMFGTLLHECVHAFLHFYSCSSNVKKCNQDICKAAFTEHTGRTGHGTAWVNLAKNVQQVARDRFSSMTHLNIDTSVSLELRARGKVVRV